MYERYQADPTSVEPSWIEFFKTYNPGVAATTSAPKAGTPPVPPIPKATQQVLTPAPSTLAAPVVSTPALVTSTPISAPVPVVSTPAPVAAPVVSTPAPAQAPIKPAPVLATPSAATMEPLRGVAGRVVASMEASLTVPTATSVRAIPAKLMIDNRTVITNHLKRTRGGKVSFTHLIAYAMIKALRAMPEMNAFYGEVDGKPALGKPEHLNLGIAIDLAKPDGTRQLLVPSIKGCEALDFGQFWVAYEEIVKKARAGSLTVEDYAGTTV